MIDFSVYYSAPNNVLMYPWVLFFIIPIIPIMWMLLFSNLVTWLGEDATSEAVKRRRKLRWFVLMSRSLIMLLLLIAIASPFIEKETIVEGDPYLRILIDNSTSYSLFDLSIANKVVSAIGSSIRVETSTFGAKETSAIGDAILGNLQNNGNILLISDGNNNFGRDLGDVSLYAARLNASISGLLLKPVHNDARIWVSGPSKTLEDVDNRFTIHIATTGASKTTHVTSILDDVVIFDKVTAEQEIPIVQKLGPGYHRLIAQIEAGDDYFVQNNIFYKTIKVVKKPHVFFYTKVESPLYTLLSQTYDMSKGSVLPQDLSVYHAIVINNLNAEDISDQDVDRIIDFSSDGNGVVVIGGDNSFEKGAYKDSRFEEILPVYVAEPGKKEGDINVVVVMDISGSQGQRVGPGGAVSVDVEKAQTLSIISDMRPENKLAIVAFNTQSFEIEPLSYISEKAGHVEKVKRLQHGGGTMIGQGLFKALEILKPAEGSKNIILISDGITQLPDETFKTAALASKLGVRIYTVGVGPQTNDFVMKKIAENSNGIYFRTEQLDRVRILFGKAEEGDAKRFTVSILDGNHFITQDLSPPNAVITGYNIVVPKTTGSSLLTTQVGDPILTAWRYGLGRIIAYTTDDGSQLAGEMLSAQNSYVITRMMNWAIGDPDRTSESFVDIEDTRVNTPSKIIVKSLQPPKADGVAFFKTSDDLYRATIVPSNLGFNSLIDAQFAVNYADEFADLGVSPGFEKVVYATKGSMYLPNQADAIINEVRSRSKRSVMKKQFMRWMFIVSAMFIFLIEVALRRLISKQRG
ncbi:MAG: vWA domain-containing protein [Nanoarchaeota archaeon]